MYTTAGGVDHVSWCRPLWVYTTTVGVNHDLWCRPLWVYATANGVDHFWFTPQPAQCSRILQHPVLAPSIHF